MEKKERLYLFNNNPVLRLLSIVNKMFDIENVQTHIFLKIIVVGKFALGQ